MGSESVRHDWATKQPLSLKIKLTWKRRQVEIEEVNFEKVLYPSVFLLRSLESSWNSISGISTKRKYMVSLIASQVTHIYLKKLRKIFYRKRCINFAKTWSILPSNPLLYHLAYILEKRLKQSKCLTVLSGSSTAYTKNSCEHWRFVPYNTRVWLY